MCGIVGILGLPDAPRKVREGLTRLEYRGYDSAGIAWLDEAGIEVVKDVGTVAGLPDVGQGTLAVGHTRWATHGGVTQANAHPHLDGTGRYAVVHNGTIEGHTALRRDLEADGAMMRSDTDTEALAHRYERMRRDAEPLGALRATLGGLEGSWALVILDADAQALAFARHRTPLIMGVVEGGGIILASDVTAIIEHTRTVCFLDDGDHGVVTADGVELYSGDGKAKAITTTTVDWDVRQAERAGYPHFMLKEIHETPSAINQCLAGRLQQTPVRVTTGMPEEMADANRIRIIACGTSYHAGLMGQQFFEHWAGIPVEVHVASEFRHRPLLEQSGTWTIGISQSGETLDTLEALRVIDAAGEPVVGVVNVEGSSLARLATATIGIHVGPEVGVAATKTFTGQVVTLALMALEAGMANGHLTGRRAEELAQEVERLPRVVEAVVNDDAWKELGQTLAKANDLFFLGRGIHVATALEAALKFKEITYLHAEGFGAGELKHGPFALLSPETPCVFFVPEGELAQKVTGNAIEVSARGSPVYAIVQGTPDLEGIAAGVLQVPSMNPLLAAVPFSIAGQLVSYHAAASLQRSIDRPRNLAKSVTVE